MEDKKIKRKFILKRIPRMIMCLVTVFCLVFGETTHAYAFDASTVESAKQLIGSGQMPADIVQQAYIGVTTTLSGAAAALVSPAVAPYLIVAAALAAGGYIVYNQTDGQPLQYLKKLVNSAEDRLGELVEKWQGHYFVNSAGNVVVDATVATDIEDIVQSFGEITADSLLHAYNFVEAPAEFEDLRFILKNYYINGGAEMSGSYFPLLFNSSDATLMGATSSAWNYAFVETIYGSPNNFHGVPSAAVSEAGNTRSEFMQFSGPDTIYNNGDLISSGLSNTIGMGYRWAPTSFTANDTTIHGFTFSADYYNKSGTLSTANMGTCFYYDDIHSIYDNFNPVSTNGIIQWQSTLGSMSIIRETAFAYDLSSCKPVILFKGMVKDKNGQWHEGCFYRSSTSNSKSPINYITSSNMTNYVDQTKIGSKFHDTFDLANYDFDPESDMWLELDSPVPYAVGVGVTDVPIQLGEDTIAGAYDQLWSREWWREHYGELVADQVYGLPYEDVAVMPGVKYVVNELADTLCPADAITDTAFGEPDPPVGPTDPPIDPSFEGLPSAIDNIFEAAGHYIPEPVLDLFILFGSATILLLIIRKVVLD